MGPINVNQVGGGSTNDFWAIFCGRLWAKSEIQSKRKFRLAIDWLASLHANKNAKSGSQNFFESNICRNA